MRWPCFGWASIGQVILKFFATGLNLQIGAYITFIRPSGPAIYFFWGLIIRANDVSPRWGDFGICVA